MTGTTSNFVVDMTHGGVKIAVSLSKKGEDVYGYDIYNTLNTLEKEFLNVYNVKLITLDDLKNLRGNLNVISPVHSPLTQDDIKKNNENLNYNFITHHQCIGTLIKNWGEDILKVEVTGVKGKTSSVFMLKEILNDKNPLILSSLGAVLYENGMEHILKRDISIAPANIKETIDLAYKFTNPLCCNNYPPKYSSAIFESSLGVTGTGDVGLLTNIVEDYPIAGNKLKASDAKRQIFNCRCIVIEKETLDTYYPDISHNKINSFSLNSTDANLYVKYVNCSLDKTHLDLKYENVKCIDESEISGEISLDVFAPGKHHVLNVLGVVLTALSLKIKPEDIRESIKNYKGITGRTSKKIIKNSTIIEEINPGINTEAIKNSIEMIKDLKNYTIAIGGDYGITCEEIDEDKLSRYLKNIKQDIILTGDVGLSISKKINKNIAFVKNPKEIYEKCIKNNKNLLIIYRSDYKKLSKR